ncbi:hypothetical protein [Desulfatitalea alkaliphila]|nr:hypothetical protein [Desulfatitalea alkaliphila]
MGTIDQNVRRLNDDERRGAPTAPGRTRGTGARRFSSALKGDRP